MARQYKPLPSPLDYRQLSHDKQMTTLTKLYFIKVSDEPMFLGKKWNPSYGKIRSFLSKRPVEETALLYDYLYSLPEKTPMDLSGVYTRAAQWNSEQRFKGQQPVDLPKYDTFENILKNEWGIDL